jgi:hypothetical protein
MGLDGNVKKGDRVMFLHPHAGWGGDVLSAAEHLKRGMTYTVEDVSEDRITRYVIRRFVELREVPDVRFISTQFEMDGREPSE